MIKITSLRNIRIKWSNITYHIL